MEIYIVGTPIGNLKDITYRAVEILNSVDLIFSEDTRVTRKLLNRYGIKKKLVSFNEHNELKKIIELEKLSKKIEKIALVSDAGTPLVSDPGKNLVKYAFFNKIKLTPIPGASALTTLLSVMPFDTTSFIFTGFLEKKETQKIEQLKKLFESGKTFIFFETPKRIVNTLNTLKSLNEDLEILIGRELTKKFEEIIYGNIVEIVEKFRDKEVKGEFIVAVSNYQKQDKNEDDFEKDIKIMLSLNFSIKDIATFISKKYNLKKNFIYNLLKERKNCEAV